jgi:hypothetical protein
MACNCNNCPYKHVSTALSTAGLLTVTNATNVGNFDKFCLILTINPDSVITTAPVDYTITINGTAVPILDRWGYPLTTDRLRTRKCYVGRYVESATPHVTLMNALSNEASVTTTASTGS